MFTKEVRVDVKWLEDMMTTQFHCPQELSGVPDKVISGYPKEGDKLRVTFKYPDIIPVLSVLHSTQQTVY